jgi:hypothetical protein
VNGTTHSEGDAMINPGMIVAVDEWLDRDTAQVYKDQPLAQDLIRAFKVIEESGEAMAEFILCTGQNPRKPQDDSARERFLQEMADAALSLIYGIQHFTKDIGLTRQYIVGAQYKHAGRVPGLLQS